MKITGSEAIIKALIAEHVDTIFGYPGGQIVDFYDTLYDYTDSIRHILVRHEQGAIHAAQGYARVKGQPGVVVCTSGPGATNVVTGIADAIIDSTPMVIIAGQVKSSLLGTDAFQETDLVGLTAPITKWNCQIRRAEDVAAIVARAFYIARSGRPGPVVLDVTKDAQIGMTDFDYKPIDFIRSYVPYPALRNDKIAKAAQMLNDAERPFVVFGQGIILSHAEAELTELLHKADIPAGCTLLGLSALPSACPQYKGMVGMHGNIGPNYMTQHCDLLVAIGMRFDDRATGNTSTYAKQAKIIHIDIDNSEINKNIPVDLGILGDAQQVLNQLIPLVQAKQHPEWNAVADRCMEIENKKVILPETEPVEGPIKMGEVVTAIAKATNDNAIIVTDVGQNQMAGARYSRYVQSRSLITSGGLGTMGFGLPAAIGAKVGNPNRTVCLFVGDGGFQMTLQELGTIMQEQIKVKIILLNNSWLGNVRQWQQMFWNKRYSATHMENPDYMQLAKAYHIASRTVEQRDELETAIQEMLATDAPFILDVHVIEQGLIFPMRPPGKGLDDIMLNETEWFEYGN